MPTSAAFVLVPMFFGSKPSMSGDVELNPGPTNQIEEMIALVIGLNTQYKRVRSTLLRAWR